MWGVLLVNTSGILEADGRTVIIPMTSIRMITITPAIDAGPYAFVSIQVRYTEFANQAGRL